MSARVSIKTPLRWRFFSSAVLLVVSVVLIYFAPGNAGKTPSGTPYYNAAWFIPIVALCLIAIPAFLIVVTSIRGLRLTRIRGYYLLQIIGKPLLLAIAFGLYVQLSLFISFIWATTLTLFCLFWFTGLRRPKYFALTVGLAFGLEFVFLDVLDIWMPQPSFSFPSLLEIWGS